MEKKINIPIKIIEEKFNKLLNAAVITTETSTLFFKGDEPIKIITEEYFPEYLI